MVFVLGHLILGEAGGGPPRSFSLPCRRCWRMPGALTTDMVAAATITASVVALVTWL